MRIPFIACLFTLPVLLAAQPVDRTYMYSEGDGEDYAVSAEARARIEAAAPKVAQIQPERAGRLLVFSLHIKNGVRVRGHKSIPYTHYALDQMAANTGAFEIVYSDDVNDLRREYLDRFDAVAFVNTGGVITEDKRLQHDLLDYIFEGGGFVGIHAAGATFCQWPRYDFFPEFGEMLGGWENGGHPWRPDEWITLQVDEPEHPLNSGFPEVEFEISDEVFQFSEPYSRNRQRMLLSIHPEKTNWDAARRILPERLANRDISISWVKRYGRGRVFYTSFGHNDHLNWNGPILQHYLDGIQFAMGQLPASTVPSAKLSPAMHAQEQLGWRFGIEAYTFKDNTFFETIEATDELGLAWVGGLNVQQVSADIAKPLDPNLSDEEIRQVRSKLVAHGLSMLTYFIFDIPGEEAAARRIFEFGKKLGVETFISEPKIEDLDLIERLCVEYNIKLAIHNHGTRLSPVYMYPEKIVELCKGRSPLIGAACDFGHWAKEGIDPLEAVKILGDRIITIQMHDQSAIDASGHDVPWGTGVVQLPEILDYLHTHDIQPVMFGLEYSYNWGNSLPEIEASIEFFNQESLRIASDHE